MWKTTNGGTKWTPLTSNQFSLATGAIAVDPNNHLNIYVGTGEENFAGDSYYGGGLLKSTNGGSTWSHVGTTTFGGPLTSGLGGAFIGGIAIQPGSAGTPIVLVASQYSSGTNGLRSGIWRSTDGGNTFAPVLPSSASSNAWATSILFVSNTTAYAAIGNIFGDASNGIYKSVDAGSTWTAANGSGTTALISGTNAGRIVMIGASSSPSTLYASIQSPFSFGLAGMFKSTDGGASWNPINTPLNTGGGGSTADFCGGQCWYDMIVAVSPSNPNLLYAGGSLNYNAGNGGLYMSTNGGTSWSSVNPGNNGQGLHPDFHAIAFAPNNKLYIGNDGGVWNTTNIGTSSVAWMNLNSTLSITEFYPGLSISAGNINVAIDGTQDNGMQLFAGNLLWQVVDTNFCGDGSWAAIDPTNALTMFASCSENQTFATKSADGGSSWIGIDTTINHSQPAQFVAPLVMDVNNPNTLYVGTDHVWRTTTGADAWSQISPSLSGSTSSFDAITSIAPSPTNSMTVYAGTGNGRLWFTTNGGTTWSQVTSGIPPRYLTMVQGDPRVTGVFYATFSGFSGFNGDTRGHVFKCAVVSVACTDISSNLLNIPVNDIVIDPDLANTLYVATDVGVFKSTNGGIKWATMSSGLPNVAVVGLKLHRASRTLRAVTHGRSAWDLLVPAADLAISGTETPNPVAVGAQLSYQFTIVNQGPASATSVTFSNVVPTGTTFLSASTSVGSCTTPAVGGTGKVSCKFGTVAKNGGATVNMILKDTAVHGSVIKDTATVTSSTPDPVSTNNSVALSTNVN
ncbi:MAG: exo-alpha-sialidase [Terriglobales bacterium]